jgi:hypothetical protein
MRVCANLPLAARDVRLDLFHGLANWAIFLDHIPHEVLSSLTTRNYGAAGILLMTAVAYCRTWSKARDRVFASSARIGELA